MKKELDWRKTIYRELKEKGMTQRDFCRRFNIVNSHLNDVLKGRKSMNIRIAVALEFVCIGTAEIWMKFQTQEHIKEEKIRIGWND